MKYRLKKDYFLYATAIANRPMIDPTMVTIGDMDAFVAVGATVVSMVLTTVGT
jgi:hypothetical protein